MQLTRYICAPPQQISALTVCSTTACKVVPSAIDVCTDMLDSFGFLFKAIVNATTPTGLVCVFFACVRLARIWLEDHDVGD